MYHYYCTNNFFLASSVSDKRASSVVAQESHRSLCEFCVCLLYILKFNMNICIIIALSEFTPSAPCLSAVIRPPITELASKTSGMSIERL